ncbi:MAG: chromate transporter [Bacillota bacterium]|jgi:chromate transporter
MMLLWQLFYTFAGIGAIAFGGGYVIIPLINKQVVERLAWLSAAEFIDIVAIAEMTPGPIAINSATFVGFRQAGVLGSIAATAGVVTPSLIIVLILAMLIKRFGESPLLKSAMTGVRPVVVGMITAAVWSVGQKSLINWQAWVMAAVMFVLLTRTKVHPILLIALSAVFGIIFL